MYLLLILFCSFFFFFNDTATTEIYTGWYTLSLHDALPICCPPGWACNAATSSCVAEAARDRSEEHTSELQSHHPISYAVFCLKKKNRHKIFLNKHLSFLQNITLYEHPIN